MIPEAQKGFQVLKEWVRASAYDLDFHPQTPFLTDLIRTATLGLRFDEKSASEYLYRGKTLHSRAYPLERYIRPQGQAFIIPELLASIQGTAPWCLTAGILSLR